MQDWIGLIERSHTLEADLGGWLRALAEAALPLLGEGEGVTALVFCGRGDRVDVEAAASSGGTRDLVAMATDSHRLASPDVFERVYRANRAAASLSEILGVDSPLTQPIRETSGGRYCETIGIVAHASVGRGVAISSPLRRATTMAARDRARWTRIAQHVGAGLRLRLALRRAERTPDGDAILDANGRVQDARGSATGAREREWLREAVVRSERARGRMRRESPEDAIALWQALVAGRWSLVDRFDRDGRRFLVAHRNEPCSADPRGLAPRERQVAEMLGRGTSPKEIAYALGLAHSTVSHALSRACRKLGVSLVELSTLFAPSGLCARFAELELGSERLAVASAALLDPIALLRLSAAEREVAILAVRGATNEEIARERGASERTVANQIQAVYRKLGVGSRSQLAARLQRPAG